jgi:hypothetical protein
MRMGRQNYVNRVSRTYNARGNDNSHDSGLAKEVAVRIASERSRHEAGQEAIQLGARVAETGQLDDRVTAESQTSANGQLEEGDATCSYVLAHHAWGNRKA